MSRAAGQTVAPAVPYDVPPPRAHTRGEHLTARSAGGRRWPRLILTSRKVSPDGTPDPASGTRVDGDGVTVLFVGKDWHPAPGQTAVLAEELRGRPVLEIVGTSMAAAERARRRLRLAWKVGDLATAGRIAPDVARTLHGRI